MSVGSGSSLFCSGVGLDVPVSGIIQTPVHVNFLPVKMFFPVYDFASSIGGLDLTPRVA